MEEIEKMEEEEPRPGLMARMVEWAREHYYGAAAAVTCALSALTVPVPAYADTALSNVAGLLQNGLTFLGGAMVVFGAVTIGINVSGTAQGNGGAIASGVATAIGGAIIVAASLYFGQLDTSWAR